MKYIMKLDLINKQVNGSTKMFIILTKPEFTELKRLLSNYVLLSRYDRIAETNLHNQSLVKLNYLFFKGLAANLKDPRVIDSVNKSTRKFVKISILVTSYKNVKGNSDLLTSITELFTNNKDVNVIEYSDLKFEAEINIL